MPFQKLPLLGLLAEKFTSGGIDFTNGFFVCVQHVLTETGGLIEALIACGARPDRIYLLGKPYSTNITSLEKIRALGVNSFPFQHRHAPGRYSEAFALAVDELWATVLPAVDRSSKTAPLIILDDGGYCLSHRPLSIRQRVRVAGVEQTSSGLQKRRSFTDIPVIAVASSAAKKIIEPAIVNRAVIDKLRNRIDIDNSQITIGVIGLGNIGHTIAQHNAQTGRRTIVYDRDQLLLARFVDRYPAARADNVHSLVQSADIVFGCTGEDVFEGLHNWSALGEGRKSLASCSSGDIEFRTLLRSDIGVPEIPENIFSTFNYDFGALSVQLLEGGFPITFDRQPISAPLEDIQFTRALLFAAVAQAFVCAQRKQMQSGLIALSPAMQRWIIQEWCRIRPCRCQDYPNSALVGLREERWIGKHSEGRHLTIPLDRLFL